MKISKLALACLAFVFGGCGGDEKSEPNPIPQPILSINVVAPYYPEWEAWVIIHNTKGMLVDYKQVEAGEVVTFETTGDIPDDKINVTFLRYIGTSDVDYHTLTTYMFIPKGQTWTLKVHPGFEPGPKIGEFRVEVSDVPLGFLGAVSDKFAHSGHSDWSNDIYSSNQEVFDNGRNWFVYVADQFGNPRYKMFEGVRDNDLFKISYNDMTPFEKLLDVSFPSTNKINFHISGDESDIGPAGYWVNSNYNHLDDVVRTSLKLGYTDRFVKFRTYLRINYPDRSLEYSKNGAAPDEINFPLTANFSTQNKSISNFNFTKNQAFTLRKSYWASADPDVSPQPIVNWEVISPDGAQVINEWPGELTTKYPGIAIDKMVYQSTNFLTESPSYQSLIDATFKGATLPDVASYGVIVK